MTLALMTTGCNTAPRKPQGDPLFGNVKPQPGLNTADASNTNTVPPMPGPTSTGSTAALASVNPRPIDGTHDLRIPDGNVAANGNSAWNGGAGGIGTAPPINVPTGPAATSTASPVALAPGGQLQQPPPGFAPVSRMQSGGAAPSAGSNGSMTYEDAQARLTARGVSWQRLETWGDQGDWKFTCSIPNKQNPYISRTYEAEAHDPLSAVRGVLDQLDHDQR
jgi:hypothetical protein